MNLYPSLTNRLKTQHESLPVIIAGVSEQNLETNPAPGKWSIKDNIAHLAKYQPLFIERMYQILEHDGVIFERYNADLDPDFPAWQKRQTSNLLNQLANDRRIILSLFKTLEPDQLKRVGVHPKYGKLNILEWAEFFLLHEAHHLFTIFQLAKSLA